MVHPNTVAMTVAGTGARAEVIAAALLHDVVEDTPATLTEIEREFGPDVASLIEQLTDVSRPRDGKKAIRKKIDRLHSAAACPEGQTIKLADLIDNSASILPHDTKFATCYMQEMRALLEVLTSGHPALLARAWDIVYSWEAENASRPTKSGRS